MVQERGRFIILISIVLISGFSQGMLLPLIAIIFEQDGVSSSINGLHATSLYIGILIASPFMEKPIQKYGFKPLIFVGGILVFTSFFLFPLWHSLTFWFILRMIIGIGDNMLHFGSQTWITTTVSEQRRGRSIALYGLSFALGFSIGPLMTRLLVIHEALPFIISGVLSLFVWSLMFFVKNEWPHETEGEFQTVNSTTSRFMKTFAIAWVAFLPAFGYGFLESTLNGVFPVYGLRLGHDVEMLSLIIPCFAIGSIVMQFPLGAWSDVLGRRKVLLISIALGIISFICASIYEDSLLGLFITFSVAGMFVGSLFSLGISYMADLLPVSLIPAGNIFIGIIFSVGSILGPIMGGWFIDAFSQLSFFYLIVVVLVSIMIALLLHRDRLKN